MKKIIFVFLIFAAASAQNLMADEINWKSYKEGMAISKKTGKNVYMYFHASWCRYCKQMKQTTFKDKKVVEYLNQHYVAISVDGDNEKDIVGKYGVRGYPDSFFLADGRTSHRPGFIPANMLYMMLSYIETDSYLKMSFSKFVKANR